MGKPKFSRKKYDTPSHPWQEDRIKAENDLIKKYGLKNKREVWKAETRLRRYRSQARELLAKIGGGDPQTKKESNQLLMYLTKLNILLEGSTLDDVLALNAESILSRRLQTLTYMKGLANTPVHARQLIAHGHIAIADRKITVPGYMVTKDEEDGIGYMNSSPLNDTMHPSRPSGDFTSPKIKDEAKPSTIKEQQNSTLSPETIEPSKKDISKGEKEKKMDKESDKTIDKEPPTKVKQHSSNKEKKEE
jgi:small subunit ribosomal protein S4